MIKTGIKEMNKFLLMIQYQTYPKFVICAKNRDMYGKSSMDYDLYYIVDSIMSIYLSYNLQIPVCNVKHLL